MNTPFESWNNRVLAALDNPSRQALVAEIGQWRTQHLGDVVAQREAAFSLAQLWAAMGERERAIQEAQGLVSLCRTQPKSAPEARRAANQLLQQLTTNATVTVNTPTTRDRVPKPGWSVERVLRLGAEQDWGGVLAVVGERRGHQPQLVRTWARLGLALAGHADGLRQAFEELTEYLRQQHRQPPAATSAAPALSTPLARLLGKAVPSRREARLKVLDRWLAKHPSGIDDLASLALDDHVTTQGPKRGAPWLATYIAKALLAFPDQKTQKLVDQLRNQQVFAVHAYDEPAFKRLFSILKALDSASIHSVRRGVLPRRESANYPIWTARIHHLNTEVMLAVAPKQGAFPELSHQLAKRLVHLCPRVVLVALGEDHRVFRAQAAELGIAVPEQTDEQTVAQALSQAAQAKVIARPASEPSPEDELRQLLSAEATPQLEQLVPLIQQLRRFNAAFRAWQNAVPGLPVAERETRLLAVLTAVHRVAQPQLRLPEGTSLAVQLATHPQASTALPDLLMGDGPGVRFGGPGIGDLVDLARQVVAGGWDIQRVVRGVTHRELSTHPALAAMEQEVSGLWRLAIAHQDKRATLWLVDALSAQGLAALPQLVPPEHRGLVVATPSTQGTHALGLPVVQWSGQEGEAVRQGLRDLGASEQH